MFKVDQIINHAGDKWVIGAVGAERDGKTLLHLWSTTRIVCKAKNGNVPVNICDWVPNEQAAA